MHSREQLVQIAIDTLKLLKTDNADNRESNNQLASYLYTADTALSEYLLKLKEYTQLKKPTSKQSKEAGNLLEQIVLLVFKGLEGVQNIKSFQSAGPQYDLLISGDDVAWLYVCDLLYLDIDKRNIVVEAKATKSPVPDKQFARLCSIMHLNLEGSGLGIFFTLNGASGFPKPNSSRQRAVSDCRLRQIVFHAKTNKIIVVLDQNDIFELDKNGTFLQILTRKIRDLFELSGLPTTPAEKLKELDLPPHLKVLLDSEK